MNIIEEIKDIATELRNNVPYGYNAEKQTRLCQLIAQLPPDVALRLQPGSIPKGEFIRRIAKRVNGVMATQKLAQQDKSNPPVSREELLSHIRWIYDTIPNVDGFCPILGKIKITIRGGRHNWSLYLDSLEKAEEALEEIFPETLVKVEEITSIDPLGTEKVIRTFNVDWNFDGHGKHRLSSAS